MNPFEALSIKSQSLIHQMNVFFPELSQVMFFSFFALVFCYLLAGVDDLLIDVLAVWKGVRPKELTKADMTFISKMPQKNIAIIIPAWDEGEIIGRMLLGNIEGIEYSHYHVFVGCYPNDAGTIAAVESAADHENRIHAVTNFKDGPTSKGQILNWVIDSIFDWERANHIKFDAFLMHDSEDLIHPKSLKLLNYELNDADFIQIPVFSLELRAFELVAGVYVDEFAEAHTKDVLVRAKLGGCVPSAGVGTCMSRDFLKDYLKSGQGRLFNDQCLTEDYELGINSGLMGARQAFVSTFYKDDLTGKKDFIATREYFPKGFRRSVRQKTRWTMGIDLQCWRSIGWQGSFIQRYFLFRDRKGLVTNPLMLLGYVWSAAFGLLLAFAPAQLSGFDLARFSGVVGLTGIFAVNRLVQRMIAVGRVYGFRSVLGVPFRLPVGNMINGFAVLNSVYKDVKSRLTKTSVAWVKTSHELPQHFGLNHGLRDEGKPATAAVESGS